TPPAMTFASAGDEPGRHAGLRNDEQPRGDIAPAARGHPGISRACGLPRSSLANTIRPAHLPRRRITLLSPVLHDAPLISLFWPFELERLRWPEHGGALLIGA